MNIRELLERCVNPAISDIFLTSGKIPSCRLNGQVCELDCPQLTAEEITAFRESVLNESGRIHYAETQTADSSIQITNTIRCRLNFYETFSGSAIVARTVHSAADIDMEKLGMPVEFLKKMSALKQGLILITGSTGSGKSTTMAALVQEINRTRQVHILTLEDPVEYCYPEIQSLISQRELTGIRGGFPEALKNALRENPDVIVVGEMRDTETIQTAITASMTGHLVISTLHTSDTVSTVERIISMFPGDMRDRIAQDLSLSLQAVMAQRLVPSVTGGQLPVFEILAVTAPVRDQIQKQNYAGLEDHLERDTQSGSIPFNRAICRSFKQGLISRESAFAASGNPASLQMMLKGMESGENAFRDHYSTSSDRPDINGVDMVALLRTVVKSGASDLIATCATPPMLRLHGKLVSLDLPSMTNSDVQKLLYSTINQRQRTTLEKERELDFALSVKLKINNEESDYRFRFNAFFQRGNVGFVARSISSVIPEPEKLGIPPVLLTQSMKKQGLILVTGPTGSGKTTTLASLIQMLNKSASKHIITIEDPVEYIYPNLHSIIEQREVHSDTLSFAAGLRAAMRQNPDVILIGEMRDTETIAAALTAAETGHLVFATLHTNNATETVERIVDSFPADQQNQIRVQFASALSCVISQRLLPRLDGNGRIAAFEVMIATSAVKELIRENKAFMLPNVLETSRRDGMITLQRAMEYLVSTGKISPTEIQFFLTENSVPEKKD